MFLGQFAYIEATDREPGATFDLRLPSLTSSQSSSFCLKLKYNLNGQHIGRLDVVKVLSDGSEDVMFTQSGSERADFSFNKRSLTSVFSPDQDDVWRDQMLDFSRDASATRVLIRGVRGGTSVQQPFGDIAIDDVMVYSCC